MEKEQGNKEISSLRKDLLVGFTNSSIIFIVLFFILTKKQNVIIPPSPQPSRKG